MVAPCQCCFVYSDGARAEDIFYGSDGLCYINLCPLFGKCLLRVFYINHSTGERSGQCPCAACFRESQGTPCLSLRGLFKDDELDGAGTEDATLIPEQDLDDLSEFLYGVPGFGLVSSNDALDAQDPKRFEEKSSDTEALSVETGYQTIEEDTDPKTTSSLSHTVLSLFLSRTTLSSDPSQHNLPVSGTEVLEVLTALFLSFTLIMTYEGLSIYRYIKELPSPPPFLWKVVATGLVAVSLKYCRYGIL